MNFPDLNEKNFILYAAHHYQNPHCTGIDEFYDDLKYFKYLKRLFNRYLNKGEAKTNLICNHLIFLFNIFGESAVRMLFFKLEEQYWPLLKPFLIQLSYLPEVVQGVNGKTIITDSIALNQTFIDCLREI